MITKVIVIILVCLKFDFIHPLPDIIRIGKEEMMMKKNFFFYVNGVSE